MPCPLGGGLEPLGPRRRMYASLAPHSVCLHVNAYVPGFKQAIRPDGRMIMSHRSSTTAFALAAALMLTMGVAPAADDSKYPNWKGQWSRFNTNHEGQAVKFDPTKPSGPGQQAPLTPEYQKILADSMADQAEGGIGNYPTARCILGGMPRVMSPTRQEYQGRYTVLEVETRGFNGPRAYDHTGLPLHFDQSVNLQGAVLYRQE